MKALRILFMGTPEFAVGILDKLVTEGYTIVGVITAPDRPAGRGRQLNESAVKKYAMKHTIKVLQPTNLKDADFLESLRSLNVDLQIVVAFRMLPRVVWEMPRYGTFNLHASLLPQYRGAAPINWAIINGETKTGVTTFFIDEKIDTGAIILQDETFIYETDNAQDLHDRLMRLGATTVLKTVKRIENANFETTPQSDYANFKEAPKLHKETCEIDWKKPISDIYNFIRGLSPYPYCLDYLTQRRAGTNHQDLPDYFRTCRTSTTLWNPGLYQKGNESSGKRRLHKFTGNSTTGEKKDAGQRCVKRANSGRKRKNGVNPRHYWAAGNVKKTLLYQQTP